jgi:hypothetical protein
MSVLIFSLLDVVRVMKSVRKWDRLRMYSKLRSGKLNGRNFFGGQSVEDFVYCATAPVGQGLLIHEVSRLHTTTNHGR